MDRTFIEDDVPAPSDHLDGEVVLYRTLAPGAAVTLRLAH